MANGRLKLEDWRCELFAWQMGDRRLEIGVGRLEMVV